MSDQAVSYGLIEKNSGAFVCVNLEPRDEDVFSLAATIDEDAVIYKTANPAHIVDILHDTSHTSNPSEIPEWPDLFWDGQEIVPVVFVGDLNPGLSAFDARQSGEVHFVTISDPNDLSSIVVEAMANPGPKL